MTAAPSEDDLLHALAAGDRRALARAITLVESRRPEDIRRAHALLDAVLPKTGRARRIGVSGPPGAGKSTLIEALGLHVTGLGLKLAVLAVDPSSTRSGGSILGDKTRMAELAQAPLAYIRPSPSRGALGGVAERTREAMLLCEAAGFDVVIVETVGVGQSEVAVADMVDLFALILAPGGGDELQGIKRGIVELAELVIVNKADGDLIGTAQHLAAEYVAALSLLRPLSPAWKPEVVLCSALAREGIAEVWATMERQRAALEGAGELARRRRGQARDWLWRQVSEGVVAALRADAGTRALAQALEAQVEAGTLSTAAAADRLIAAFRTKA
ncbi:MAG: methylmalonyl Co-A mutase-associated GTPase MeaB [Alphaproteobacteria bacterium]|nr:methylmalonyl Co-A mutase-associated GTPase MeaB [Alphaproteobacteria bacterium]